MLIGVEERERERERVKALDGEEFQDSRYIRLSQAILKKSAERAQRVGHFTCRSQPIRHTRFEILFFD